MKRSLTVALIIAVALYVVNFLVLGFLIGPFDFNHLSGYYELAYRFWKSESGLPSYNPYLCGGRSLGADPQIPIFHPLVMLVPFLGPTITLKWEMLAQLSLGTLALVFWLRRYQVSTEGILWGSIAYLCGGGVVSRFMVGHVTLGFYVLFPAFFYLSYRLSEARGPEKHRVRIFYWLLFIYSGLYKPNFLIYAVPILLLEVSIRSLLTRRLSVLIEFIYAVVLCGLIGAVVFLPAQEYFREFPRRDGSEPQFTTLLTWFANLVVPLKALPKSWYGNGFMQRHEYNFFLGPMALWFAWRARGSLRSSAYRNELVALLAFAVVSVWIGLGSHSKHFELALPFTWLRTVWPGFASIRVPVRFWYGSYLALIIFSAIGWRSPYGRWLKRAVLMLALAPLLGNAAVNLFKTSVFAEETQWIASRQFPTEIAAVRRHPDDSYRDLREGKSLIDCVDNLEVNKPTNLVEGSLIGSKGFENHWDNWSKVSIRRLDLSRDRLELNLNHHRFWKATKGVLISSHNGERLSVQIPKGVTDFELHYFQPLVREGMWLSVFGLALFAVSTVLPFLNHRRKTVTI